MHISTLWKYKVVSGRYDLLLFFFFLNLPITLHLEVKFQGHTPLVTEILRKMFRNKVLSTTDTTFYAPTCIFYFGSKRS